ncbi:MAG: hypothetical protein AAGA75_19460 [Cyanobacteria bacterium P01_E01_bin.6]
MNKKKKKEIRVYIPAGMDKLIRALSVLKNGEKDWSLSAIAEEAFGDWLAKADNQELIEKHRLDEAE